MSGRFKVPALPGKMKDPLSQKVPANPKYKDVRPTVDTGASMTKYLERLREIKSDYKYKKGEIFKRIKVTSLVGLMIKVAEMNEAVTEEQRKKAASSVDGATYDGESGTVVASAPADPSESAQASRPSSSRTFSNLGASSETSSSSAAAFLPPPAMSTRSARSKRSESIIAASLPYFPHPSSLRRSTDSSNISSSSLSRPATSYSRSNSSLKGLIGGIGERTTSLESVEEDKENSATPSSLEPPYLLLDIREEDAFNSGHLRTAINFPSSRLSRAMNFESKELRSFRNGDGKIIVVYDEDETMAPRAAAILVQRGYDNIYLLSGGINVAEKFFPGGLLMKPEDSSVLTATTPLVLSSEENAKLQFQLEDAKKASSPSHRPTVDTTFDRRRTQMMGGQFKTKKAVPKPNW